VPRHQSTYQSINYSVNQFFFDKKNRQTVVKTVISDNIKLADALESMSVIPATANVQ